MTAIVASHYRNPRNDFVGRKHHHKHRFRPRQSSRSAFYHPELVLRDHVNNNINDNDDDSIKQQQQQQQQQQNDHWNFRPSSLQYSDYAELQVPDIVDCYVKDNERALQEGVKIPPKPKENTQQYHHRTHNLRCLQWNIQAFLSPQQTRNMETITAGIVRAICEKDADLLVLNEIHWRGLLEEKETEQIQNSQALLEEVLLLRGYSFLRIAQHGDTPTMLVTSKKVLSFQEVRLSDNRSALCVLIELDALTASCCWVVGTHLDAFDGRQRLEETKRLLDFFKGKEPSAPILIMGDFNQQRAKDYHPHEWKRIVQSAEHRKVPIDDGVADCLEAASFRCVLDETSSSSLQTNWEGCLPPSTHWSGTTIDYTYYHNPNNNNNESLLRCSPMGVYVGAEGFSDHRMTVTDWKVSPPPPHNNKPRTAQEEMTTTTRSHPTYIEKSFFFDHLPEGRHHSWAYYT